MIFIVALFNKFYISKSFNCYDEYILFGYFYFNTTVNNININYNIGLDLEYLSYIFNYYYITKVKRLNNNFQTKTSKEKYDVSTCRFYIFFKKDLLKKIIYSTYTILITNQ